MGLETIDQQIAVLFGNGTLQRQADVLVETVQQKDSVMKEIFHMNIGARSGEPPSSSPSSGRSAT